MFCKGFEHYLVDWEEKRGIITCTEEAAGAFPCLAIGSWCCWQELSLYTWHSVHISSLLYWRSSRKQSSPFPSLSWEEVFTRWITWPKRSHVWEKVRCCETRFTRSEAVERTPVSIEREDPVSEFSSSNITIGNCLPQLLQASSEVVKGRVPPPSQHGQAYGCLRLPVWETVAVVHILLTLLTS